MTDEMADMRSGVKRGLYAVQIRLLKGVIAPEGAEQLRAAAQAAIQAIDDEDWPGLRKAYDQLYTWYDCLGDLLTLLVNFLAAAEDEAANNVPMCP